MRLQQQLLLLLPASVPHSKRGPAFAPQTKLLVLPLSPPQRRNPIKQKDKIIALETAAAAGATATAAAAAAAATAAAADCQGLWPPLFWCAFVGASAAAAFSENNKKRISSTTTEAAARCVAAQIQQPLALQRQPTARRSPLPTRSLCFLSLSLESICCRC